MNLSLPCMYEKIYDERFSYEDFGCRIKLQTEVYLLENMSVNVGINPQLTDRQINGHAFSVSKSICITEV